MCVARAFVLFQSARLSSSSSSSSYPSSQTRARWEAQPGTSIPRSPKGRPRGSTSTQAFPCNALPHPPPPQPSETVGARRGRNTPNKGKQAYKARPCWPSWRSWQKACHSGSSVTLLNAEQGDSMWAHQWPSITS